MSAAHPIILYDDVCALCTRLNQFTLRGDKRGIFRFAALQSGFARELLTRHGANPDDLDTFSVVTDHGGAAEQLRCRAEAALYVLSGLRWTLAHPYGLWHFADFHSASRVSPHRA